MKNDRQQSIGMKQAHTHTQTHEKKNELKQKMRCCPKILNGQYPLEQMRSIRFENKTTKCKQSKQKYTL